MLMITNQTSETLHLEAKLVDNKSYDTNIPPGGSWNVPNDVQAVFVEEE